MKQFWVRKSIALLVLLSFFCSFTQLYAVEGQFNVSVTVGADTTAPSIPTGLSATAISSTQIDLSWTASTDNVAVTAYRVYRDSVFVATSTLTTYSDVGLTPSTTYSYTVSAVDASYNASAQSASASATTFATPVVTPPTTTGGTGTSGQHQSPVIYDLLVTPSTKGAIVTWKTTQPSQSTFSWGLTGDYELGSSGETVLSLSHSVTLRDLTPATQYVFKINAVNAFGIQGSLENQIFTTLSLESGRLNANNFVATPDTSSILLSWNNPAIDDFAEVRVVKNTSYYPADENDGQVIYEGGAEKFQDNDVTVGTRYYYALFVKYSDGSYSSGLLAQGRIPLPGEIVKPYDPFDYLPASPRVDPLINQLTFTDFDFIQNGKKIGSISNGEKVSIDGNQNLTVSLAYEKVPEVLKSIVVTLTSPDDETKTFSFLLRVNKEKTAYTATIGALQVSGIYGVKISIVDYKNQGLKKILGSLSASVETVFDSNQSMLRLLGIFILNNSWNFLLIIILLYLIYRALRDLVRRHKNKEEIEHIIVPPIIESNIVPDIHPVIEEIDIHPMKRD